MHICSPVHFHPAREPWPEELIPHQVEVFLCSAAEQLSQSFQYTTFFFFPLQFSLCQVQSENLWRFKPE